MSELNNQFNKFINSVNDNFFIFWDFLKDLYNSILKGFNFGTEFKLLLSQLTENIDSFIKILVDRINLEFSNIKIILNSLSTNGKIITSVGLLIVLTLIFTFFFLPKNDKNINNKRNVNLKAKSKRTQLLEIEIDLLELQDKYTRNVISLNSYQSEAKRLKAKAEKLYN